MPGGLFHRYGGDKREFTITHGSDTITVVVTRDSHGVAPELKFYDLKPRGWEVTWTADALTCVLRHDGQTMRIATSYEHKPAPYRPAMRVTVKGSRDWKIDWDPHTRHSDPKDRQP